MKVKLNDLDRMSDAEFERYLRRIGPYSATREPRFWKWDVSEDEPGLGSLIAAFIVLVAFLVGISVLILVMAP